MIRKILQDKMRHCVNLASQCVLRHFFKFNGQNLFVPKLSKTLELLKIKSKLLIIYKFPQNDTHASYTYIKACFFRYLINVKLNLS